MTEIMPEVSGFYLDFNFVGEVNIQQLHTQRSECTTYVHIDYFLATGEGL